MLQHHSRSTTRTLAHLCHHFNSFPIGFLAFSALPTLPIHLPRVVSGNANLVISYIPAHAHNMPQELNPELPHRLQSKQALVPFLYNNCLS